MVRASVFSGVLAALELGVRHHESAFVVGEHHAYERRVERLGRVQGGDVAVHAHHVLRDAERALLDAGGLQPLIGAAHRRDLRRLGTHDVRGELLDEGARRTALGDRRHRHGGRVVGVMCATNARSTGLPAGVDELPVELVLEPQPAMSSAPRTTSAARDL